MTEMNEMTDLCRICKRPRLDHNFNHKFVGPNDSPGLVQVDKEVPPPPDSSPQDPVREQPQDRVRTMPPGDSVLRMALLRAGVITLAQLEEVEAELKGAGIAYHSETLGQPRDR